MSDFMRYKVLAVAINFPKWATHVILCDDFKKFRVRYNKGKTKESKGLSWLSSCEVGLSWFKTFCQFSPEKSSPVEKRLFL